jgi:site-specific DNA-methyltransferase (adenine-specific)
LNIDGARIPTSESLNGGAYAEGGQDRYDGYENWRFKRNGDAGVFHQPEGRWPANFVLDEDAAERLDAQGGGTSVTGVRSARSKAAIVEQTAWLAANHQSTEYPNDTGGASRYFFNVQSQLDEADPVRYCAKASRRERDGGLDEADSKTFGMSNGAQTHGQDYDKGQGIGSNRSRQVKNNHPTVKPLALCQWLATLLLPPAAYAPRRLLVPFSGSGSEMIGGLQAGWDLVMGIEKEAEYVELTQARIVFHVPN